MKYARLPHARVQELEDWVSLWGDLLHVDMALHARDLTAATAPTVFARRALWEGAVVAYGRTIKGGCRRVMIRSLIDALGADARATHDEIIRWRDKHIAHRVERGRERVGCTAIIDPTAAEITGIEVVLEPSIGPQAEGELETRFATLVKALRDSVWEQHIGPVERQIIQAETPGVADLLASAVDEPPGVRDGFGITLHPNGAPLP